MTRYARKGQMLKTCEKLHKKRVSLHGYMREGIAQKCTLKKSYVTRYMRWSFSDVYKKPLPTRNRHIRRVPAEQIGRTQERIRASLDRDIVDSAAPKRKSDKPDTLKEPDRCRSIIQNMIVK